MVEKKNKKPELSAIDKKILQAIYELKETNLNVISKHVKLSKSTVHSRIKRLKNIKFLQGVIPIINQDYIKNQITAISLIKARYGPEYAEDVGRRLSKINGVWAVYFVLGSYDFIVLLRAQNNQQLENIVNELTKTEGVERSETIMAIKLLKEDFPESYILSIKD